MASHPKELSITIAIGHDGATEVFRQVATLGGIALLHTFSSVRSFLLVVRMLRL